MLIIIFDTMFHCAKKLEKNAHYVRNMGMERGCVHNNVSCYKRKSPLALSRSNKKQNLQRSHQKGMLLIEALVAIFIFAIGIVGVLGMGARAVNSQSDAQYREEASQLANEIIQEITLNVDRTNDESITTSLAVFQYNADGSSCDFSGGGADKVIVPSWVSKVQASATGLPGSKEGKQQIKIDTTNGVNSVTVTICWQTPSDSVARKHTMVGFVN